MPGTTVRTKIEPIPCDSAVSKLSPSSPTSLGWLFPLTVRLDVTKASIAGIFPSFGGVTAPLCRSCVITCPSTMSLLRIVLAAMAVPPSATISAAIATISAGDGRRLSLDLTVPPFAAQPTTHGRLRGIGSSGQLVAESLGRAPQRQLGIDTKATGLVHELEQGLADPA